MDAQNIIIPILNLNSEKDVATLKTLLTEIENIEEFTVDLNTKSVSITAKKLPKITAKVYEALKQNKFEINSVQKTYPVLNMTCASCASSSQANLQRQIGVVNAEVNYGNGMGKIEYIPNVITPNNDGINDLWDLNKFLKDYPNSVVEIFDRFGKKVKTISQVDNFKWDGRIAGKPVPTDNYWYVIKLNDKQTKSGSILIKNK